MKSIVFIIPYIGKWPLWFDAFLLSTRRNETINWLFITDCAIPKEYPENVRFIPSTLQMLNNEINITLDAQVPLTSRKLCDIRPAYGKLFQEHIKSFDFWGFCDVDIIWGDVRNFITDEMLANYDIISSRKEAISGHFTIFRNTESINDFYTSIPNYSYLIRQTRYMWSEEQVLTMHLKSIMENQNTPKVYWTSILCNKENGIDSHQEYYLDKWLWKDGKMIDVITNEEVMYLHFINWKRTLKRCDVNYSDNPLQFYISYTGIHFNKHSSLVHIYNKFKNVINGYWVKERRRIRKKKFNSFKKKLINKLK